MPDTPEIAPALTAEEWRKGIDNVIFRAHEAEWGGGLVIEVGNDGRDPHFTTVPELARTHGVTLIDDVPKLMALCNHALPRNDLRKITREKLEALTIVVRRQWPIERHEEVAEQLLRALAALLPPEGLTGT